MNEFEKSIAIVGVGPRGVYAFERLITALRNIKTDTKITIHLIEPMEIGAGVVYNTNQPDYLLMNTLAYQVTAFTDYSLQNTKNINTGPNLQEWINSNLRPIEDNQYPTRSEHGKYLSWVIKELLENNYLENVAINVHQNYAIDIFHGENGKILVLDDGSMIEANKILLTTGNVAQSEVDFFEKLFGKNYDIVKEKVKTIFNPYPLEDKVNYITHSDTVCILGLGLTFIDIVFSLTIGKGGEFVETDGKYKYIPSGLEPKVVAYSRSGLPLMARSINQKGQFGQYKPTFLTIHNIDKLKSKKGKLDFDKDILPLILKDMILAFNNALDEVLIDTTLKGYQSLKQEFNWNVLIDPLDMSNHIFESKTEFHQFLLEFLNFDINESKKGNVNNPLKAACDVLRDIRDNIRYAVEFESLNARSHKNFLDNFIPAYNRIAVGPPLFNIQKILSLIEAGILDISFGNNAELEFDKVNEKVVLKTTAFKTNYTENLTVLIDGRINHKSSSLIKRLLLKGMAREATNRDYDWEFPLKTIEITRNNHVVRANGEIDDNISAHGQIAEGTLWYTQVTARPGVNSRALGDASKWADEMVKFIQIK